MNRRMKGIRRIDTRTKRKLVTQSYQQNKRETPYKTTNECSKMKAFKDALVEKACGRLQDFIDEQMMVHPSQYSRGRYWTMMETNVRGAFTKMPR